MTIKDLSSSLLATLKETRYDRIIEKHEGPATWSWELPDESRKERMKEMYGDRDLDFDLDAHADFLEIGGVQVLLPVGNDHHENMTFLHHFFSEDRQKIVLYIKDTTYDDDVWVQDSSLFAINIPMSRFIWRLFITSGLSLIMTRWRIDLK